MLTLRAIFSLWNHPQLQLKDNTYKLVFPDVYQEELTSNQWYCQEHVLFESLEVSAKNKFLAGNRRVGTNGKTYYGAAMLSNNLKEHLLSEAIVIYKEREHSVPIWNTAENMIQNIQNYVSTTGTMTRVMMDHNHPLFQSFVVDEFCLYDSDLVWGMKKLLYKNSEASISYALFLLILTAIYQEHITDFYRFYKESRIRMVLGEVEEVQIMDFMDDPKEEASYEQFTDPAYMKTYHLYIHNPSYNRLYDMASLKMEVDPKGIPQATLLLQTGPMEQDGILKKFTGIPILCRKEEMVFISLTNPEGLYAFLCFRYDFFRFREMYYRTAFFVSVCPKPKVPQLQKVAICLRKLQPEEMPLVAGILKMNDGNISITEEQLQGFMDQFADAKWMPEFQRVFLPFIKAHKRTYYVFSEQEILSYSMSNMDVLDRTWLVEALKARMEVGETMRCQEPEKLYRIIGKRIEKN